MNARFVPPADEQVIPRHQPFSWLHRTLEGDRHAEFVALTNDICRGAELALQLAQESELERDHVQNGGYLSPTQCGNLQMLAMRALKMLADRAEAEISDLNDVALSREAGDAA